MQALKILNAIAIAGSFAWASTASAHCDTLDGPVVAAARSALETGQLEHALIWVQQPDERAIRAAFDTARSARAKGGAAAERADRAFYATLVRVHRTGEGAPFTGLKPAGHVEPPIAAADRALAAGSRAEVEKLIVARTHDGLRQRFDQVAAKKNFATTDVRTGRAYVGAYVDYVHYDERVYYSPGPAEAHGARRSAGRNAQNGRRKSRRERLFPTGQARPLGGPLVPHAGSGGRTGRCDRPCWPRGLAKPPKTFTEFKIKFCSSPGLPM